MQEDEFSQTTETPDSSPGSASAGGTDPGGEIPADPLEAARAEAAQFRDKMLRTAADFDNYRKRSRREVQEAEKKGRDSLLRDLLPVFDNLERAVDHATGAQDNVEAAWKGLSEGITLVMRQFHDTLTRLGLERVQAVGQPFDPAVHEAIQHLETDAHPPGTVAAEVQAGYVEGGRLVRPALVVVAKSKPADDSGANRPETSPSN